VIESFARPGAGKQDDNKKHRKPMQSYASLIEALTLDGCLESCLFSGFKHVVRSKSMRSSQQGDLSDGGFIPTSPIRVLTRPRLSDERFGYPLALKTRIMFVLAVNSRRIPSSPPEHRVRHVKASKGVELEARRRGDHHYRRSMPVSRRGINHEWAESP